MAEGGRNTPHEGGTANAVHQHHQDEPAGLGRRPPWKRHEAGAHPFGDDGVRGTRVENGSGHEGRCGGNTVVGWGNGCVAIDKLQPGRKRRQSFMLLGGNGENFDLEEEQAFPTSHENSTTI